MNRPLPQTQPQDRLIFAIVMSLAVSGVVYLVAKCGSWIYVWAISKSWLLPDSVNRYLSHSTIYRYLDQIMSFARYHAEIIAIPAAGVLLIAFWLYRGHTRTTPKPPV